ncbi:YdeI family protein [Virgibacillus halophilus]|uniref:YdeI/OmpD-associated family protein n=1 Tax=Tigheibacillus halophilus TaxID=361280 RepID=UPI003628C15F
MKNGNTGMNSKVDEYVGKAKRWKKESEILREIVRGCGLTEEFKWMHPCYTYKGKNIVLIHGFKAYCALLFHKGALLKDSHGILTQQTENVQAARQIRFTSAQEILDMAPFLKAYIHEAIEVEKAGLKVNFKRQTEPAFPEEFQKKLDEIPALKTAFASLTPGRQRAYLLYFGAAKQSKTRESRVEKYMQQILDGKGLHDR